MKSNILLVIATLTFTQLSSMAFADNKPAKKKQKRAPAAESKLTPAAPKKKVISEKEMKELKAKLAKLEEDLKAKTALVDAKTKELEQVKSAQNDEKIDRLHKLLEEQKAQIDKLREEIKSTEVKNITVVKQEHIDVRNQINVIICQAKAQATKLEDEIQKLLKDKEEVLRQVSLLKEENEKLKTAAVAKPEVKPEEKKEAVVAEVKPEEKKEEEKKEEEKKEEDKKEVAKADKKKSYSNEDVVEMLSQITNMMMSQQQAQMQMQASMFSMMLSMNNMNSSSNMFSNMNPYGLSFDYAPYSTFGFHHAYPSLSDSIQLHGYGIGNSFGIDNGIFGYPTYGNGGFQPYTQVSPAPTQRQPSSMSLMPEASTSFGTRGFDFNLNSSSPMQQPELPQMQRSMI